MNTNQKDKMDNLITELETATEGRRELDGPIFRFYVMPDVDWEAEKGPWWPCEVTFCRHFNVPEFTTSLDAALTWMPEGCVIELCQSCPARADDTWWDAYVFKRPRDHDSEPIGATEQGVPEPALAVCIAIAKARQS